MKKRSLLTTLILLIGLGTYTVLNTSYSTGFPSYQSACSCHGAANAATTVAINAPTFYTPGASYPVTVTVTNTTLTQAGFQIQTNIGTLSSTDPDVTIQAGGMSAGHNKRKSMVANVATFSLTWTAPTPGGTAATFNAVGNAVDGVGTGNDQWNSAPSSNVALPVSFTNVVAKYFGSHVSVSFETSSEENVRSFEIERSLDANTFNTVSEIIPNGAGTYEYKDYELAQGAQYYYRIKETSLNEEVAYSNVVRALTETNNIQMYPTVLENNLLTISGVDTKENLEVEMFDQFGRKVFSQALESNVVNLPSVNSGYYFVAIYENRQAIHAQKIFVK